MRPDAEEILRLVLARLDDMKAEDTVTIDLTGKSSIAERLKESCGEGLSLADALRTARAALAGPDRTIDANALEVPRTPRSSTPTGSRWP